MGNEKREACPRYYPLASHQVIADFRWMGQHSLPGQVIAVEEPTIVWAYPPVVDPENTVLRVTLSKIWGQPDENALEHAGNPRHGH